MRSNSVTLISPAWHFTFPLQYDIMALQIMAHLPPAFSAII